MSDKSVLESVLSVEGRKNRDHIEIILRLGKEDVSTIANLIWQGN